MDTTHLEPARTVLAKIGVANAAAITGKHISRCYRWMKSRERGGTDGRIPSADAAKLLQYAEANGLELTPADFFARTPEKAA